MEQTSITHLSKISKICWITLIFALCINMLSMDIYLPAMPFMISELTTTPFKLKLVFIFNFIEFSVAAWIWGAYADINGRRPAALIVIGLATFGQLLSVFSSDFYTLVAARGIQYLGAGALSSIILTLICDSYQAHSRAKAIALFEMALPLAILVGPSLGASMIQYIGWRGTFLLFGLIQIVCFIVIMITLHETLQSKKRVNMREIITGILNIINNPNMIIVICILGLAEGGLMIFNISASFFYMQNFNLKVLSYAVYQSITVLFFLIGVILYRFLLKKSTPFQIFNFSMLSYLLCIVGIFFLKKNIIVATPLSICCIMCVMNFFCGIIGPSGNTIILERANEKLISTSAATITAVINCIVGSSMFIGNYIVDNKLLESFFNYMILTICICGLLWLSYLRTNKDRVKKWLC